MHASVMAWAASWAPLLGKEGPSLEVGSHDVNGSIRRYLAEPSCGVDLFPGRGVEVRASAWRLPFADETFAVVASTEMLEHDPAFWRSVPEMARVLRPGGVLLMTARGNGFPLHLHPWDLWRFMPEAFGVLFDLAGVEPIEVMEDPDPASPGVLGLARKP